MQDENIYISTVEDVEIGEEIYQDIQEEGQPVEELYTEEYQPVEVVEEGIEISEGIEETYFTDDTPESDNIFETAEVLGSGEVDPGVVESEANSGVTNPVQSEPEPQIDTTQDEESATTSDYYDQILSYLQSAPTSSDINALTEKLEEINDSIYTLNSNVVKHDSNQSVFFRFQIGFMVAIFGALLIYMVFSKFS